MALTPARWTHSQGVGVCIENMSCTPGTPDKCCASAAETLPHRTTYSLHLRSRKHRNPWYRHAPHYQNRTQRPPLEIANVFCASPLPSISHTIPQFAHAALVACIGGRDEPCNRTLRTHPVQPHAPQQAAPLSPRTKCIHSKRSTHAVELEQSHGIASQYINEQYKPHSHAHAKHIHSVVDLA